MGSSAEYNRRAVIIETLRAGCLSTEIIRFSGYLRLTVYYITKKYADVEKCKEGLVNPARQSYSEDCNDSSSHQKN